MFSRQFLISELEVCFTAKTNYGKSISRQFFAFEILNFQKAAFLQQLCLNLRIATVSIPCDPH